MSVISLAEARQERQPHWGGPAICIGCRHEWVAVAAVGVEWIECPSCLEPKGHPKRPFGADVGDSVFECKCGCEAMTAYVREKDRRFVFRCMGCGTDQTSAIWGES